MLIEVCWIWSFQRSLAPAPALPGWGEAAEHPLLTLKNKIQIQRYGTAVMGSHKSPTVRTATGSGAGSPRAACDDCKHLHRVYWQLPLKVTHQQRAQIPGKKSCSYVTAAWMLAGAQRSSSLQCGWEGGVLEGGGNKTRTSPSHIQHPEHATCRSALTLLSFWVHKILTCSSRTYAFQCPRLALQVETGPWCPQTLVWTGETGRERHVANRNASTGRELCCLSRPGPQGTHGGAHHLNVGCETP